MQGISRRSLVLKAAQVGGYGAALSMMHALGLAPSAQAAVMTRDPTIGRGRRVVILGGGVAGLVSAYELDRAGFAVTVLEARARVGGRNWSVRGGDRVQHIHGPGQDVGFAPGQYFNAGPARLPSHHETILGYCRELGVPLEVEINSSRSAFVVRKDGSRLRMRQVVNDTRGLVSELLAKLANQGALDQLVDGVETKRLLDFLRLYGGLDKETLAFNGTTRSGFTTPPGAAAQAGVAVGKLDWAAITDPALILAHIFEEDVDMQPTMFQPVGGMDQIPKAFAAKLDGRIRLGCEVLALDNRADGVRVVWKEAGEVRKLDADFAVSTMPAPYLTRLESNFTEGFKQALAAVEQDHACKIAWQAPRFWEREDQIYGGLGYLEHEVRFLWYPSDRLHAEEGVLVAGYNAGPRAKEFGELSLSARLASSRAAVELAHPGRSGLLQHGVSVVWRDQRFSEGPWAHLDTKSAMYTKLCAPEGRVYLAGDWLSHIAGWQEGAALSAQRAVTAIAARAQTQNLAANL